MATPRYLAAAMAALLSSGLPAMAAEETAVSPVETADLSDEQVADAVARAQGLDTEDPLVDELGLAPKRGPIALPGGIAALDVPREFYYLSPEESDKVLVAWGNPPGNTTLGMLVPTEAGVGREDSWAVVITYDNDGHVADDDATEIDYDDLLKDMKQASADENAARKEAGYPVIELVGWAEEPRYDKSTHKFFWAKQLRFGDEGGDTLNYAVRVLGREGVLQLNAVSSMAQISQVRHGMPDVIRMASFVEGQRYEDFNESTDRTAAYGLAALVAGGTAAKLGLWAKLVALLVAFKKFILFGVIAVGAWFAQRFRKGKDTTSA